jgi:two-component system response regulator YesN
MNALIQDAARKPHETYNYREKEKRGYLFTRLQKTLLYIEDNSSKDIHLKDVAAYVGLNPDYLERQLHQQMATTFLKWLNSCRLKTALARFNDTNKTISEIAYECGFNDPFIFSHVFKRHFGLSPRQFRDKYSHKSFGA